VKINESIKNKKCCFAPGGCYSVTGCGPFMLYADRRLTKDEFEEAVRKCKYRDVDPKLKLEQLELPTVSVW
jgi:hypothetical protein